MNNRPNEFVSAGYPSGDGAIVWQPVMMAPNGPNNVVITNGRKSKYPGMQSAPIKIFSAFCIVLGIASIGVQIAALVLYAEYVYNYVWFAGDVAGTGILSGCFCVTAGSLGIASTQKRTKSLLVWTVVLSGLSIAASIAASTVSGIAASRGFYYNCYYYVYPANSCDAWLALEWSLMGISVAATISSIVLNVLASVAVCCGRRSNSAASNHQAIHYGTAMGQQPIYFKPQLVQQQQQQTAYVQQQVQQPPLAMQFVAAAPTAPPPSTQQEKPPAPIPVAQQQQQQPSRADEILEVKVHPVD